MRIRSPKGAPFTSNEYAIPSNDYDNADVWLRAEDLYDGDGSTHEISSMNIIYADSQFETEAHTEFGTETAQEIHFIMALDNPYHHVGGF